MSKKKQDVAKDEPQGMTLEQWLKKEGVVIATPSRKAFRDYTGSESKLVLRMGKAQDNPEDAQSAQEELRDLQDEFMEKAYPRQNVLDMPADLFWELLTATVGKGFGAIRGN